MQNQSATQDRIAVDVRLYRKGGEIATEWRAVRRNGEWHHVRIEDPDAVHPGFDDEMPIGRALFSPVDPDTGRYIRFLAVPGSAWNNLGRAAALFDAYDAIASGSIRHGEGLTLFCSAQHAGYGTDIARFAAESILDNEPDASEQSDDLRLIGFGLEDLLEHEGSLPSQAFVDAFAPAVRTALRSLVAERRLMSSPDTPDTPHDDQPAAAGLAP